jgi:hypothetical protein
VITGIEGIYLKGGVFTHPIKKGFESGKTITIEKRIFTIFH